jgi:hypothetical protein
LSKRLPPVRPPDSRKTDLAKPAQFGGFNHFQPLTGWTWIPPCEIFTCGESVGNTLVLLRIYREKIPPSKFDGSLFATRVVRVVTRNLDD